MQLRLYSTSNAHLLVPGASAVAYGHGAIKACLWFRTVACSALVPPERSSMPRFEPLQVSKHLLRDHRSVLQPGTR